jgi:hypothetical protein
LVPARFLPHWNTDTLLRKRLVMFCIPSEVTD